MLMTKMVMFVGALAPTEELIVKVLYSYWDCLHWNIILQTDNTKTLLL